MSSKTKWKGEEKINDLKNRSIENVQSGQQIEIKKK